ncbi:MAG TPA: undecaprenyl-diphosphate phosphatase [Candidatus Thermoplasmatota archaeon]|nr:undecaprenyl-diphosphate phosphatase [Candidatus Thermoplasmatota archaeon]
MAGTLTLLEAILLGVVQGLTEWLPVSSSGHLVLAKHFLGIEAPLFFDLALHFGTLVVVLYFFRATVLEAAAALVAIPRDYTRSRSWRTVLEHPERRLALLVVLGSIPTAVIGFTFRAQFEALHDSAFLVGCVLLFTGTYLFLTRFAPTPRPGEGQLRWPHALLMGTCQGLALIPGLSRSGSTISSALFCGVDRETAVRFSFLLSVPAILGAIVFEADGAALGDAAAHLPVYLAGIATSMAVGYAALAALVFIVKKRAFHHFAWYCWAVGLLTLALL